MTDLKGNKFESTFDLPDQYSCIHSDNYRVYVKSEDPVICSISSYLLVRRSRLSSVVVSVGVVSRDGDSVDELNVNIIDVI